MNTYGLERFKRILQTVELDVDEGGVVKVLQNIRMGKRGEGGVCVDDGQVEEHGCCLCIACCLEVLLCRSQGNVRSQASLSAIVFARTVRGHARYSHMLAWDATM